VSAPTPVPVYTHTDCVLGCTAEVHAFCSEATSVQHPWVERYLAATGFPDPEPESGGCERCFQLIPLFASRAMLRRVLLALDERNAAALRAEIEAVLR
jgi:hypothetical protein